MVHADKVPGQRGHMLIHEDGTILSSSGELASNELTSNQITSLMSHSLPVDFNAIHGSSSSGSGGDLNGMETHDTSRDSIGTPVGSHPNGSVGSGDTSNRVFKWNRITVKFGDESYVACLSNRKIHVVKYSKEQNPTSKDQHQSQM